MKTNFLNILLAAILGVATIFTSCKKTEEEPTTQESNPLTPTVVNITDDGNGIGNQTWTSDKVYLLDGFCFVNSGQTLTIQPGTVIKAKLG
jgi:hypothetical protein